MKILGLSASRRSWGNTDILVHHALSGAEAEGAAARFVRLTDLELAPCTGCMSCVFRDRECTIADGLPRLLAVLRWADAVVLGSPTYLLGATAVIKTLQERLLRHATTTWEFAGKPGLAIAAAGTHGYEPYALPQVALTFLALGMPVVDQLVGYGQGPGEVLWDSESLSRARTGGASLARGETAYRGEAGACPSCHFDLLEIREDGTARCQFCDLPGTWSWEGGKARLRPSDGAEARWSVARGRRHFTEKLLPSGPRFRARREEIQDHLRPLRDEAEKRAL